MPRRRRRCGGDFKADVRARRDACGQGRIYEARFLNGKLSLSSAEGVADLINGESEAEIRAGYLLYNERLTDRVRALQERLKDVLAAIGASVDYPEEDVEEESRDEVKNALLK